MFLVKNTSPSAMARDPSEASGGSTFGSGNFSNPCHRPQPPWLTTWGICLRKITAPLQARATSPRAFSFDPSFPPVSLVRSGPQLRRAQSCTRDFHIHLESSSHCRQSAFPSLSFGLGFRVVPALGACTSSSSPCGFRSPSQIVGFAFSKPENNLVRTVRKTGLAWLESGPLRSRSPQPFGAGK